MNELENAAGLAATPGYEYARRTENQLHVAGQVPHNATGQLVGGMDPRAQAAQCLTNLNTLLCVHGFSTRDIQRLVVYVVGEQENLTRAWTGVQQWFSGRVPPATLLGVACLGHPDQLVEVDATIIKSSAQAQ
jgi:enamine deaminase RidA (YjgF/YER057c/UK114 family)